MSRSTIHVGDCRDVLATLPDASIDSIVTDPPYELAFMGKAWDATGIAYDLTVWAECLRVLKPGGHLVAFSGSRTYHRMACAIEDAGFEIRDQIMWVYGSGFPKSLDVSKAIDKAAGVHREVVTQTVETVFGLENDKLERPAYGIGQTSATFNVHAEGATAKITTPATPEAEQWSGWGTALKPAHEPIVLARKPLTGTVAANVLQHGTGALNIDGCRIGRANGDQSTAGHRTATFGTQETQSGGDGSGGWAQNDLGRWPANFIHDGSDEVTDLFPDTKSGIAIRSKSGGNTFGGETPKPIMDDLGYGDSGSAARFFYCAKASKTDRNEGLDGFDSVNVHRFGAGIGEGKNPESPTLDRNHHPTVKPTDLMRYLCRLITPPNGVVLDPFTGSGSTGKAAMLEGFSFIGIEQDSDYAAIAEARIKHALDNREETLFND